ncbi:hypothetical protein, partial [Klebsiella pneumoniae]|uniref:hypothetical protein n=1 Tax=Klebsiella pneumoniae TaxID=573 RepID=UPI001F4B5929
LGEVEVRLHLRGAFSAGDVWHAHSRRDGGIKEVLMAMGARIHKGKQRRPSAGVEPETKKQKKKIKKRKKKRKKKKERKKKKKKKKK